ncbi:MAG TPA: hypothetical protein VMG40_19045 [Bryobacteraceae bacterium]|nr:hypothetical protein [Bryobacteraceae bacterium]
MKLKYRISKAGVLASLLVVPCWSTVLYSDGAINATYGLNYIDEGYVVSDSFTISAGSIVTGVSNIGLWVDNGTTPEELDWVISTLPEGGGTLEGSASGVTLSSSFFANSPDDDYTVDSASFSVDSLALSPGTYWLELGNAIVVGGGTSGPPVFWDVIPSGPSTAYLYNGYAGSLQPPNSFEIDGTVSGTVPEPSGWSLAGLGIALILASHRRAGHSSLPAARLGA